jgi:hypothetical protein
VSPSGSTSSGLGIESAKTEIEVSEVPARRRIDPRIWSATTPSGANAWVGRGIELGDQFPQRSQTLVSKYRGASHVRPGPDANVAWGRSVPHIMRCSGRVYRNTEVGSRLFPKRRPPDHLLQRFPNRPSKKPPIKRTENPKPPRWPSPERRLPNLYSKCTAKPARRSKNAETK